MSVQFYNLVYRLLNVSYVLIYICTEYYTLGYSILKGPSSSDDSRILIMLKDSPILC